MSAPTEARLPVPPQPTAPEKRVGARGAAAVAVVVLACGAWLLTLESCAQTTAGKPIQVDPQPQTDPQPQVDPQPDPTPRPEDLEHPAT